MRFTFNLLTEPWVPCIRQDGSPVELGLRDALVRAHELRELGGESPLVVAALYRLMLVVLHRVFGPPSIKAWAELWEKKRWDETALDAYFARWQERFDLFHPQRPFYQAPDARVQPKSVSSILHEAASGNNATLFDHHTDETSASLSPAQAARALLAAQAFGLAGLSGLPEKFTDAPCARGVIFLTKGETLFATLILNLVCYPDKEYASLPYRESDRPCWEMDDPYEPPRSVPWGYLDYLTWQNRRILFLPEETPQGIAVRRMTLAPGLRLEATVMDPMKHYFRDARRGSLPLRFVEERALWRDSAVLFQLNNVQHQPPHVFQWLSRLEDYLEQEGLHRCAYIGLGMANDQAKVNFFRSEQMPLPIEYLRDKSLVDSLSNVLKMAEDAAHQLWGAVRTLATFILSPEADAPGARQPAREDLDRLTDEWAVERRYWSRLEVPFRQTIVGIPDEPDATLEAWRNTLFQTAWAAFDEAANNQEGGNTRTLKAIVRARDQLTAGLASALPKANVA